MKYVTHDGSVFTLWPDTSRAGLIELAEVSNMVVTDFIAIAHIARNEDHFRGRQGIIL